ncbi:mucin-5AC-like isoform X3 [Labeo rohita]|uniref:Mucin-5AC-like isoform X3 n=1 Tax=Labeo rohita TaxID=84645 RepID=A0A498LJ69_LABRO|nr:mucin-5AC-like isoform X3 [Labeo rohita]RXN31566.1 mucin-5AC-like isoform X3 [Labeo rohita]
MVSKEPNHLPTVHSHSNGNPDKTPTAVTVRSVLLNRNSPDIESRLKRRRNRTQQPNGGSKLAERVDKRALAGGSGPWGHGKDNWSSDSIFEESATAPTYPWAYQTLLGPNASMFAHTAAANSVMQEYSHPNLTQSAEASLALCHADSQSQPGGSLG